MIVEAGEAGFISRVRLKDYRSIKSCDVSLGHFNVFVGANGSGKSNFLDALRFTADALNTTLPHALQERGGLQRVRRSTTTRHTHMVFRLDFNLPGYKDVFYAYELKEEQGLLVIKREQACVGGAFFDIKAGEVQRASVANIPRLTSDRLALVALSGFEAFRALYDVIAGFGFYNIIPEMIRTPQPPDVGQLLSRDGANLASVVARLDAAQLRRVCEYLAVVVPGIAGVEARALGSMMTLEFSQHGEDDHVKRFYANQMSEGTLRALALLVAMLGGGARVGRVVGIEEPEGALHPGAVEMLVEVMASMSSGAQVLMTTHSPELLDAVARADEVQARVFAVSSSADGTEIGQLDDATLGVLRGELFEPGELLRLGQLIGAAAPSRSKLFEERLGGRP